MPQESQKHLILGTAGHIDHGKTALIKAMTGIDCDTHAQEKQRGITINLGFAHLNLPSGNAISIIDVPGHKDFIHTMVSGASGIDFVLMVIAADSGIMPQTREHLQIAQMLKITCGVIALTKIDLVEEDIAELAKEEIADFTKGTFLENAAVVPVSSVTGEGIPQLISAIEECTETVTQRPRGEIFRLFIDRIFSKSGFGTIVTGSVVSGTLHTGDHAYLLPSGKKLRVRRLEKHGKEVQSVVAGDRASLNLVGLEREDFKRGMIISDRTLKKTAMIDARLTMFNHAKKATIWSEAIFLLGTYEAQIKIHLIDKNSALGGDTALVQIHLPKPSNISIGDRFIIRSTSSDITLGGGEVIDAAPLHHRRRPEKLITTLGKIAEGKLPELIAVEVRKTKNAIHYHDVAERLNLASSEVMEMIKAGLPDDIMVNTYNDSAYLITKKEYQHYQETILKNMKAHHKRNPLEEGGRTIKDLIGVLGISSTESGSEFIRILLNKLVDEKKLKQVGNTWASVEHEVVISSNVKEYLDLMDNYLKGFGMKVPLATEIESFARKNELDSKTLNQIMRYLVDKKRIYKIESDYLHSEIVDKTRIKLLKVLSKTPDGLTVAQFRDLVADNRKICLRLFTLYDSEGFTIRRGDVRVITEKGRTLLSESNG